MASGYYSDYSLIYLQPDGTWCFSPFKAHDESTPYWLHKSGIVVPYTGEQLHE